MSKRKILITAALPYVNNIPHLGNIIGSVLSADIYSRYCKLRTDIFSEVIFISGTDDYGTATELAARKKNISCEEVVKINRKKIIKIFNSFDINFSFFGSTSSSYHEKIVLKIYKSIKNKILLDSMDQFYCNFCKIYLSDRYLTGTCSKCNIYGVQGDQCDSCGHFLNNDIIDPECILCKKTPILKNVDHLFLNLPILKDKIKNLQKNTNFTKNAKQITDSWLQKDLHPRCITRNTSWGIKVPTDGLNEDFERVFYVWFDAVIGYISFFYRYKEESKKNGSSNEVFEAENFSGVDSRHPLKDNNEIKNFSGLDSDKESVKERIRRFESLSNQNIENVKKDENIENVKKDKNFKNIETVKKDKNIENVKKDENNNSNTHKNSSTFKNSSLNFLDDIKYALSDYELVQFMGKDNVPFHTIIFPAITDKIANNLSATEYLLFENKKFSKSKQIGIFDTDFIKSDYWRYYLCFIRPEGKDTNFNVNHFLDVIKELRNNFGNLCNRVLKFLNKGNCGKVSYIINRDIENNDKDIEKNFKDENLIVNQDKLFIDKINFLIKSYNQNMLKINLKNSLKILSDISQECNLFLQKNLKSENQKNKFSLIFSVIAILSKFYEPFIPNTCIKLQKMMRIENFDFNHNFDDFFIFENHEIENKIEILFEPFGKEVIEKLKSFSTSDSDSKIEFNGKDKNKLDKNFKNMKIN